MSHREAVVARISPWSAFRVSLSLSLVGLVAWMICVVVLYFGLDAVGIWEQVNDIIGGVGGRQTVSFGIIISLAALAGAVGVVAAAILGPLLAVIYNAIVSLFGGLVVQVEDAARPVKHAQRDRLSATASSSPAAAEE